MFSIACLVQTEASSPCDIADFLVVSFRFKAHVLILSCLVEVFSKLADFFVFVGLVAFC